MSRSSSLNAQVLAQYDDVETHQRFSKELGLQFPLIADTDRKIQTLYRKGRVTFLIDQEGVIRFIQEGMPKNDVLLDEVRKIAADNNILVSGGREDVVSAAIAFDSMPHLGYDN
jgi:peroxiredoxin